MGLHFQTQCSQIGGDALTDFQLVQQALGLATGHFTGLVMLDGGNHLLFHLGQRLDCFGLVTSDVQHQRLAVSQLDHVGVGVVIAQLFGERHGEHLGIIQRSRSSRLGEEIGRLNLHPHGISGQIQRVRVFEAVVSHLLLLGEELLLGLVSLQTGDGLFFHIGKRLGLGGFNPQQLDDVETERALHHAGEIASLVQGERGFLEGRIHHPFLEPVQLAAFFGREGIGRVSLGQRSEIITRLGFGQHGFCFLLGRFLVLAKRDQDVSHVATLGTLEQILVLIVVILGILLGDLDILGEVGSVQQQIVDLDLLVVHETGAIGLVVLLQLVVGGLNVSHVVGSSQTHQTQIASLVVELVELLRFALEGEFGAQQGAHQLLTHHVLTQGVTEHFRSHAGTTDQLQIAVIVELAVLGKLRHGHDGLLDLFVTDTQTQFTGLAVQQRLIDQAIQHTATELFHVIGVRGQLAECLSHLGFHAGALVTVGIFQCRSTDLGAIDGGGGGTGRAVQVTTYTSQGKGEDDQAQDNLGYLALRPFA